MIKLRNKAISIITFIIFFISSQYPYTISIFGSSKAEILRRSRAGYSLVSDDLRSFLDSLSPFDSLSLSEALNQRDIEQELAARAIEIEYSIVRAFGWDFLSNEDQAVLIWMAQELIEAALTFNVQRSGYDQAVSDVATPVLGEIISNIDGIVSSLEELCGQALDINDPAAFLVISPWLIIAMKYQLDNGCLVSETIDYMQDLIGKVKETGLDFNLTDSYEVGEVVAYVNVLSVADTLGTGYEGLAANVLLWSSIYRVSQDYVLSLAQGAIEHKAIVEAALSDIGKSGGHESVVPWLNAAMDRAIREDTSIEAAMNDMAVIIRFMQGEGASQIAANISEELGRDFDWTNSQDVALMASSIETVLELAMSVPGWPIDAPRLSGTFSPGTFNIIRDLLVLAYAGLNFSNYADSSSLTHALADTALLGLIFRPIVDMALLMAQRLFHVAVEEGGPSPSMGDAPKDSFYGQFFGRLPEWIHGNIIFLRDEWWPQSLAGRSYDRIKALVTGAEYSAPERLAVPGARTAHNLLNMAFIPPLFSMYILNRIAGSAAGSLVPVSPEVGNLMFGVALFGGILTVSKLISPITSRIHAFGDRTATGFFAGLADSALELVLSTALLMPMNYYLPMMHIRELRNIRQNYLEGRAPARTPGWLINAKWTIDSISESYRVEAPTVAAGALLGLGLGMFNPLTALYSIPIWGGMIASPLVAYFMRPKP